VPHRPNGLRLPARRYQFTPEELPFWEPFESVAVEGRAGSLFLWDSRTAHAVRAAEPALSSAHVPAAVRPASAETPLTRLQRSSSPARPLAQC